jgi:hypothetical protein
MRLEHGLIPEEPGMEEVYTIIPDTQRMNPTCGCPARTCPNHGFCKYCLTHHMYIDRMLAERGIPGHYAYCQRQETEK